jgi:hypothetical protein
MPKEASRHGNEGSERRPEGWVEVAAIREREVAE